MKENGKYLFYTKKSGQDAYNACQTACSNTAGCNGFSLNKADANCYLKKIKSNMCPLPARAIAGWNSSASGWIFYKSDRYLSLGKDCGTPNQREWQTPYSHNKKGSKDAYDACKKACADKQGCDGFSLNNTDATCYLKRIKSGQCAIPAGASPAWNSSNPDWIFYKKQ